MASRNGTVMVCRSMRGRCADVSSLTHCRAPQPRALTFADDHGDILTEVVYGCSLCVICSGVLMLSFFDWLSGKFCKSIALPTSEGRSTRPERVLHDILKPAYVNMESISVSILYMYFTTIALLSYSRGYPWCCD